jgi:hypothetical protein
MPIDTSMYRANPLRSVADYESELLRNDLSKQQISENALAFGEKQRGIADQTALRTAMSGLGGGATNAQRIQTARASGSQAGDSLADTLEKADLERRKTEAAAGKQELEAAEIKRKLHVMDLWSVDSPEAAIAWAEGGLKSGVFNPEQYQRGVQTLQKAIASPGGFEKWKQQAFAAGMAPPQQMEQARLAANADVTANNQPLIKGPDGKWVVNQPLEGFKSRVASAGAANQLGAPIAGVVPGTDTPVYVQPPRTPGGVGQVVQGVVPAPKAGAAEKAEEKRAVNVRKYSETLQKHSIPEFEGALGELENVLSKYPKGKAPGLGRGAGLVPDWMQGAEGENIRQALAGVKNILLKARSGAAVTENELRRMVEELGSGGFRSEETLRAGIERIRKRFEHVKANAAAGVDDDVKGQYEEQGGVKIVRGGAKPAANNGPSSARARADVIVGGN